MAEFASPEGTETTQWPQLSWLLPHVCRAKTFLPRFVCKSFVSKDFASSITQEEKVEGWMLRYCLSLCSATCLISRTTWAALLGWKVLNSVLSLGPQLCQGNCLRWCIRNRRPGLSYFVPSYCLATYQACLKPLKNTRAQDEKKNPMVISREDSSWG